MAVLMCCNFNINVGQSLKHLTIQFWCLFLQDAWLFCEKELLYIIKQYALK